MFTDIEIDEAQYIPDTLVPKVKTGAKQISQRDI